MSEIGYMVQDGEGRIYRNTYGDHIHWDKERAEEHAKRADDTHGFTEPWHKVLKVVIDAYCD